MDSSAAVETEGETLHEHVVGCPVECTGEECVYICDDTCHPDNSQKSIKIG